MSKHLVIAIDGPAGAGKSTVSKILAADLGLQYLDTGAMYRALAFKAQQEGVSLDDGASLARLMDSTQIAFGQGDPQPVELDGKDITEAIRTREIGDIASQISTLGPVRRALVERQRQMVDRGGVILEGRDTTTVVAPEADVKVYLTASLEERARRRTTEFECKGMNQQYDAVRSDILTRDHRDITRQDSPLSVAPGAVIIETAGLTPQRVADKIKNLVPA